MSLHPNLAKQLQIAPDSSGEGGAMVEPPLPLDNPKPKQAPERKNHFITWYYGSIDEIAPVIAKAQKLCFKGLAQTELCPSTKRPHMHLMLWGRTKFRDTVLKMPKRDGKQTWRSESLLDYHNESDYANKEKSFDGVYRIKWGFPEPLVFKVHYVQWVIWLEDILNGPVLERKIIWLWSDDGKMGKTQLIRKWVAERHAQFVLGGTYNNVMNLIANTDMNTCRHVFFSLPKDCTYVSYNALESLKDGLVSNMKSHTNTSVIFNPPHVVVFANMPPDKSRLMSDRWIIHKIDFMKGVKDFIFPKTTANKFPRYI